MPRKERIKLPENVHACEAKWSASFKDDPRGLCGQEGHHVIVVGPNVFFCCGTHAGVISRRLRRRGATFQVWYLLKKKARLIYPEEAINAD